MYIAEHRRRLRDLAADSSLSDDGKRRIAGQMTPGGPGCSLLARPRHPLIPSSVHRRCSIRQHWLVTARAGTRSSSELKQQTVYACTVYLPRSNSTRSYQSVRCLRGSLEASHDRHASTSQNGGWSVRRSEWVRSHFPHRQVSTALLMPDALSCARRGFVEASTISKHHALCMAPSTPRQEASPLSPTVAPKFWV